MTSAAPTTIAIHFFVSFRKKQGWWGNFEILTMCLGIIKVKILKWDYTKMTSKGKINKKLCTVEDGFEASDNGSSNSCCMKWKVVLSTGRTRFWTPRFSGYDRASAHMTDFFLLRTQDWWPYLLAIQPGSSPSDGFVSLKLQTGSLITASVSTFQISCFHERSFW